MPAAIMEMMLLMKGREMGPEISVCQGNELLSSRGIDRISKENESRRARMGEGQPRGFVCFVSAKLRSEEFMQANGRLRGLGASTSSRLALSCLGESPNSCTMWVSVR